MSELTTADVARYTDGRLPANVPEGNMAGSHPETQRLLNSALDAARRYCGWRVTPAAVETVTLDGPGSRLLSLPTLQLVELQSVTEDGTTVSVSDLYVSPLGLVRKKSRHCWSRHYGSIVVRMNHGYANASDFQAAVLELVDRMASSVGEVSGASGPIVEQKVGDVVTRWMNTIGDSSNQELFGMLNRALLNHYRIEPSP